MIAMIFTHAFESFYAPDYNRHLTYFVTVGFAFLAGFTFTGVYAERICSNRTSIFKLIIRGGKLLLIFLACNLPGLLLLPKRFDHMQVPEIISAMLLGTHQNLFAFDILVPIAFIVCAAGFLVRLCKGKKVLFLSLIAIALITASEISALYNYYGIKLLLTGVIGSCLAVWATTTDWPMVKARLAAPHWLGFFAIAIIVYYFTLILFSTGTHWFVSIHLIPTAFMLTMVYMASHAFSLTQLPGVSLFNATLSKHMLFAYLFHILLIGLLFLVIGHDSMSLPATIAAGCIVLGITVGVCSTLNYMIAHSPLIARTYALVFK